MFNHFKSDCQTNSNKQNQLLLSVLINNERSRNMWDLKSNSNLAKAALQDNAQRMSMMLSRSDSRPLNALSGIANRIT